MRRSAIFFIMTFLVSIFPNHSMFMLSIEKGKVYTERYNLVHFINMPSVVGIEDKHSTIGQRCNLCHYHLLLSLYILPENQTLSSNSVSLAAIDFLPPYHPVEVLLRQNHRTNKPVHDNLLKLPIPPLQQSSVLLT